MARRDHHEKAKKNNPPFSRCRPSDCHDAKVTHRASRQRTIPGSQGNIVETISGTHVPCTSHSGTIMADLLGSDDFQEDPAAEFLAREQDDLAELGEDFGEEQPEANVSSSEP